MSCPKLRALQSVFGKEVEIASENLIVVSRAALQAVNHNTILDMGLAFFRHTARRKRPVLRWAEPCDFGLDDLRFLADRCDSKKSANDRAKKIIADGVLHGVSRRPFHLFDIGCGTRPIVNKMASANPDLVFTGVDCLDQPMHVAPRFADAATNAGNIPITWEQAYGNPKVEEGRLAVCTAVYSLHFFEKDPFPDQLSYIIDMDGFFVGNLYLTGTRREKTAQLHEMEAAIAKSGLGHRCVEDGKCNSFFAIADDEEDELLDRVELAIQRSMIRNPAQRHHCP